MSICRPELLIDMSIKLRVYEISNFWAGRINLGTDRLTYNNQSEMATVKMRRGVKTLRAGPGYLASAENPVRHR